MLAHARPLARPPPARPVLLDHHLCLPWPESLPRHAIAVVAVMLQTAFPLLKQLDTCYLAILSGTGSLVSVDTKLREWDQHHNEQSRRLRH